MKFLIPICFSAFFFNVINAQSCYTQKLNSGKTLYNSGKYEQALHDFTAAQDCPDKNIKEITEWIKKATSAKTKAKNIQGVKANQEEATEIAAELIFKTFGNEIQRVQEKRSDINRFFSSNEIAGFDEYHIKIANLVSLQYLNISFHRIPVATKRYDSSKTEVFDGLTTSYTIVTPHDGELILLNPSFYKIDSITNNLRDGDKIIIKNIEAKTVDIGFTDLVGADLEKDAETVIRNMVFEFTVKNDIDKELAKKQEAKRIQDEKEKATKEGDEQKHILIEQELLNETGFEMKFIPAGTFDMGSNEGNDDNKPVHKVTLDSFYIGKYVVTQAQWKNIMGKNHDKYNHCDKCGAYGVTWDEAQEFIAKLNKKTHKLFRLPTEAEWEYAARGVKNDSHPAEANDYGSIYFDKYGQFYLTGGLKREVGKTTVNGYGIYDMIKYLGEWCSDYYDSNYYSISPPLNPRNNVAPHTFGVPHVFRGGTNEKNIVNNVFSRTRNYSDFHETIGLRLVLSQ